VQGGLGRHVGLGHGLVVGRHSAWLTRRHLGVVVFWRFDGVIVDAIRVAAGRLRGVETGLRGLVMRCDR
jgi:hypothetical protein